MVRKSGKSSAKIVKNLERKAENLSENYDKQVQSIADQIDALQDQKRAKRDERSMRIREVKSEALEEVGFNQAEILIDQIKDVHSESLPYKSYFETALEKWLVETQFDGRTVIEGEDTKFYTVRDGKIFLYNTSNRIDFVMLTSDRYPAERRRKALKDELGADVFENLVEAYERFENRRQFKKSSYKLGEDETTIKRELDDTEDDYHSHSVYADDDSDIALRVKVDKSGENVSVQEDYSSEDDEWRSMGGFSAPGFETMRIYAENKETILELMNQHRQRAERVFSEADPMPEIYDLLGEKFEEIHKEVAH